MAPNHLLDVPVIVKPTVDKDETPAVNDFELDLRADHAQKQQAPIVMGGTSTCPGHITCLSTCSYSWGC